MFKKCFQQIEFSNQKLTFDTLCTKGLSLPFRRTQQNEEKATKDLQNEDHSSCIHLTEDIVLSEEENEEKENMLVSCVVLEKY